MSLLQRTYQQQGQKKHKNKIIVQWEGNIHPSIHSLINHILRALKDQLENIFFTIFSYIFEFSLLKWYFSNFLVWRLFSWIKKLGEKKWNNSFSVLELEFSSIWAFPSLIPCGQRTQSFFKICWSLFSDQYMIYLRLCSLDIWEECEFCCFWEEFSINANWILLGSVEFYILTSCF